MMDSLRGGATCAVRCGWFLRAASTACGSQCRIAFVIFAKHQRLKQRHARHPRRTSAGALMVWRSLLGRPQYWPSSASRQAQHRSAVTSRDPLRHLYQAASAAPLPLQYPLMPTTIVPAATLLYRAERRRLICSPAQPPTRAVADPTNRATTDRPLRLGRRWRRLTARPPAMVTGVCDSTTEQHVVPCHGFDVSLLPDSAREPRRPR